MSEEIILQAKFIRKNLFFQGTCRTSRDSNPEPADFEQSFSSEKPDIYQNLGDFTRMWDFTWMVSDCEELVGEKITILNSLSK